MLRNIVGPPARGDDFFDREELVALLWERLETGNVLLAAPRRFGKTSLMYRLLDRPEPGWKPVHVDAESIRELVGGSIGIEEYLAQLRAADSFNDFERVPLPELPRAKADELVDRLSKARRLQLSASSQRKILELVGAPIPYFIQIFISEIANAKVMGLPAIGPRRLEAIYQDRLLGAASKTYFQHYYDRLRRYDKAAEQAAKEVLKALALAQPEAVDRAELRAAVRPCS